MLEYVYQYKDHIGNIRLSYSDSDNNGSVDSSEIIEENNYYPFGLQHKGYNNVINGTEYPYTYNGKEEQNELGLNWIDYGARNYDASLGRWMNIDPLAEAYYGINPYGYVFNNPVQLFDPDGMRVEYVREEGQSRKEFRQAKREFKKRNRQLGRDSKTHKANFKQLKKSKNVHKISFNRGEGSSVNPVGDQDKVNGNGTDFKVDLDQQGIENEFVIAHETQHAVEDDLGVSNPNEADVNYLKDSPEEIISKTIEASNENRKIGEESAGHVENVVRGEVSNSRGKVVPLRKMVRFGIRDPKTGLDKTDQVKVIRKNYNYYKKN